MPESLRVDENTGFDWVPCGKCPHPIETHRDPRGCLAGGGACECRHSRTDSEIVQARLAAGFSISYLPAKYMAHEPWKPRKTP